MSEHEFLINWAPRNWHIWGSQLSLNYPVLGTEGSSFIDTRANKPGLESLGFYDFFFDLSTQQAIDVHELEGDDYVSALQKIDGAEQALLCFRRRFINTWYPEIEDLKESFFADVWVVRDCQSVNLAEAHYLQSAELRLLKLLNEDEEFDEGDGLFGTDRDSVKYTAIHWRQETLNGQRWQVYEEYSAQDKIAEVLLFPLDHQHYLKIRLYHMAIRGYWEFQSLFDAYCTQIKMHLQIAPLCPPLSQLPQDFDRQCLGLASDKLRNWELLNEEVLEGRHQGYVENVPSSHKDVEESQSKSRAIFSKSGMFLLGVVLGIIISGALKTLYWLEVWEVPHSQIILMGMIASFPLAQWFGKASGKLN
jgi:hypothetical protein